MEKHLVRAWLLQHPRVECDGKPLNIRLKKAQALLFYLLVQKKATREEAAGLLWGGEEDSLAHRHLRDNLYQLKKAAPVELIRPVGRDSLTLNPDVTFRLDVDDFLSRRRLEDYVGGFLPAFSVPGSFEYDQWLEKTRTALRDEYLLQLDAAAKAALAEGRETDAERFWQRYLQEEPLCETVSVSLMELYRARRDYNRAALVYRSLHKAMSDWLGITPLKETSALYYSIMEEWNARADPEDQRSDDFLVGRQEQLQSLFQLFPGPGSGRRRQSFVLLGEAGVGKSHLLAHFLAHGAVSDAQIVTTSCFKSKQEEYLYPWQAVMLSIASYIRKEDIPIPTAYRQAVSALFPVFGSGEGSVEKKAHMLIDSVMSFDSVLMILSLAAEKRPLLLVLEDIQWMDKISADLLDQLLHKADSSRILFAATCRQPSGPVATPLLRGLEEDGLCRCCHLSPFTKDETMEFIQLYGAQSLPQADKERIYQDTQGNAFLLTQLIGSIMENGRPTVLPRNMEEILSYRLSGLTDEGLQVLNLVAMFPDRAPYPVLERVSSKPTLDLLYVCQELCRRSILTEVYDGGALSLAFAQAEFRELTYSRIPALSRRILHLNIAQALADLYPYAPCEGTIGGLSFQPYIAITYIGEGRLIDGGKVRPTAEVLKEKGIAPLKVKAREGLALLSNASHSLGVGLLALYDFVMTMRHADLTAALVCEALRSTDKAYDPRLIALKNHKETTETAQFLRDILSGSAIMDESRSLRVQDSMNTRIIPHVHGIAKRMAGQTYDALMEELYSVFDNPIFLPDGTALMGSNWDATAIELYCDSLAIAVMDVAKLTEVHMERLVDPHLSGLPAFLVKNPGLNNGFMIPQYVTAGLLGDIALLCAPAAAFNAAVSAGQESPVYRDDTAARQLYQAVQKLRSLVSMTMLTALQAIDLSDHKAMSPVTQKVHDHARQTVTFMENDDLMYQRIEAMEHLVESNQLLADCPVPFTI